MAMTEYGGGVSAVRESRGGSGGGGLGRGLCCAGGDVIVAGPMKTHAAIQRAWGSKVRMYCQGRWPIANASSMAWLHGRAGSRWRGRGGVKRVEIVADQ